MATEVSMAYHLRGNFYPPLPLDYTQPALEALAHCEAEDFDAVVVVPADVVPHPACATKTERGWELSASELVRILRLDR